MDEQNPIKQSIAWLVEQGFDEKQAQNLCRAIHAETPEQLWEAAPAWLEWCGKIKRAHDGIVMLAAMGVVTVQFGPGGVEDDIRLKLVDGIEIEEPNAQVTGSAPTNGELSDDL